MSPDILITWFSDMIVGRGGVWEYVALAITMFGIFGPGQFKQLVTLIKGLIDTTGTFIALAPALWEKITSDGKITPSEKKELSDVVVQLVAGYVYAAVEIVAWAIPMYYAYKKFQARRKNK